MTNSSSTPGSPTSLALTAQSTSPNWFVLAVPQMMRVPVGWCVLGSVLVSPPSMYAVMVSQWTFRPVPWSMYSRWPQSPCASPPGLHEPPMPKFAFAPESRTMKPPPVRKSHRTQALAGPPAASTNAAIPSTLMTLGFFFPPLASRRFAGQSHVSPRHLVGGLQRLRAPAAEAGHRGRDRHIRNAGDDRVKRVHNHGAVRPDLLFVDDQ